MTAQRTRKDKEAELHLNHYLQKNLTRGSSICEEVTEDGRGEGRKKEIHPEWTWQARKMGCIEYIQH